MIPALIKLEYKVTSIYLYFRQFLVTFGAIGLLISIILYIKSLYAKKEDINPDGSSGYTFPDFVEGREIYPRIGNLDIKFFLFRTALITIVSTI